MTLPSQALHPVVPYDADSELAIDSLSGVDSLRDSLGGVDSDGSSPQ
jgi:hypothetical protein